MQVLAVNVKSFKRIASVDLSTADKAMILVGGKNGAGKSSILDAISAALMGEKASPEEPIQRGKDSGSVVVKLEGYTVTRTWTRKADGSVGSTLKIVGPDGGIGSPQTWLSGKMGDLTCDPLAFMSAKPEAQADRLRKLTGLDVSTLDATRKRTFDARTEVGRDGQKEAAVLANMPECSDAPAAAVMPVHVQAELVEAELVEATHTSPASILEEIAAAELTERAAEVAATVYRGKQNAAAVGDDVVSNAARRAEDLRRQLAEAEAAEAAARALLPGLQAAVSAALEAKVAAETATVPTAPLRSRLAGLEAENKAARDAAAAQNAAARAKAAEANAQAQRDAAAANEAARKAADEANAKLRAKEAYKLQKQKVDALRADYAAKTDEIAKVDAQKAAMLAAAKFPVDGLSFDKDGGVTYRDLPLSQASGAERIRVSMAIALASNPTIKLVLIRDASLLDEDSLAMVAEMAEAAGAQVILERVGSGDPDAVIIVDGGTV